VTNVHSIAARVKQQQRQKLLEEAASIMRQQDPELVLHDFHDSFRLAFPSWALDIIADPQGETIRRTKK
jgi:hypothetical protein